MKFLELHEKALDWENNPKLGWWLARDPAIFYHGTHQRNIPFILENGIDAATEGATAGLVSLALEPNTAFGYAAMSGAGGETQFRGTGQRAVTTPPAERVVFQLEIPHSYFIPRMVEQRGNTAYLRNRLINENEYKNWKQSDQEYYALTEIRLPNKVPLKFVKGYTFKN